MCLHLQGPEASNALYIFSPFFFYSEIHVLICYEFNTSTIIFSFQFRLCENIGFQEVINWITLDNFLPILYTEGNDYENEEKRRR